MRILLFGANGQVGSEIVELVKRIDKNSYNADNAIHRMIQTEQMPEIELIPLSRAECDISSVEQIRNSIETHNPSVVINAAAYTAVDKAEQEQSLAKSVNQQSVEHMAKICDERKIDLFHLSTEYVFDGEKDGLYQETDITNPLNHYAKTKLAGEQAITQFCSRFYILRVNWVFGKYGHNFVKTMKRLLADRETLSVVDDQIGAPTPAADIASVIVLMLLKEHNFTQKHYGIYHYTATPFTSWCEFAKSINKILAAHNKSKCTKIIPCSTSDYPTPAKRQKNSRLDTTKLTQTFTIEPQPWLAQLEPILLNEEHS